MQGITIIRRPLMLIIALVAGLGLASTSAGPVHPANAPAGPTGAGWIYQTVAATGDVGQYNSLILDPQRGNVELSFYDASHGSLSAAWGPVAGGNCVQGNQWSCYTINSTIDVGKYSSLASNPVDKTEAVAYQDATHHALLYSVHVCTPACTWQTTLIDQSALVGQGISLKFDGGGTPHIAYYQLLPTAALKYAHYVGGGSGNCWSSNWQCDTIEGGPALGQYPSLDVDVLGLPHIAYYDAFNGWLKYASKGSSGGCSAGTVGSTWECSVVDATSGSDVGAFATLHQSQCFLGPCPDSTQIAYYDSTAHALKYAHWTGATVQCGGLGAVGWQCDQIETVGTLATPALYLSMTVANGKPYIAYNDRDDGPNGRLKLASPTTDVGNCGPSGGLFQTWQCDTLDTGSTVGGTSDVGSFPSIAMNNAGLLYVSYYDATNGDLKIAFQQLAVYLPVTMR